MKKSAVVVAVAATLLALVAPSAQARDLEPGETQWVITPSDLTSPSGKATEPSTNAQGPTIPSSCSNITSGKTASGRESLSTIMGELPYKNGSTWQSTVWTYRTPAAAQTSFSTLQTQSLARCNGSFSGLIGDDVADTPAEVVYRSRKIAGATQPRFSTATSQIMTDPTHVRPGYTDQFGYMVFTRVDNAIVQVNLYQKKPVTAAQRADASRAATAIAKRYAASV